MAMPRLNIQVLRFCVVGGAGFAVDAGGLLVLSSLHFGGPVLARAVSFSFAVCVTFLLNRKWTFDAAEGSIGSQALRYLCVQGSGLFVNLAIYVVLYNLAPEPLNAPLIDIAVTAGAAFLVNFIGSKRAVFSTDTLASGPSM